MHPVEEPAAFIAEGLTRKRVINDQIPGMQVLILFVVEDVSGPRDRQHESGRVVIPLLPLIASPVIQHPGITGAENILKCFIFVHAVI